MRFVVFIFYFSLVFSSCLATQEEQDQEIISENKDVAMDGSVYDSIYAEKVGADEYGMKSYVMAFLKMGPNRPTEKYVIDSLQSAHMANISKLADEGKLVLAGPFLSNDSLRGIYIFNTTSIEEAKSWTSTDPAIIYGSLEMELKPWYGSAALMDVGDLHKKAAKVNF